MKVRKISLDKRPVYAGFDVVAISEKEFSEKYRQSMNNIVNENDGVMGFLAISRVAFNEDFTQGYVYFFFFCGDACAWDSAIEIKKVNGHWQQSRFLFGGAS